MVMNALVDDKELKPPSDSTQSLNPDTVKSATSLPSNDLGFLLRSGGNVPGQHGAVEL